MNILRAIGARAARMYDHVVTPLHYHGPNCAWCSARPEKPTADVKVPFPEPMFLHASGRAAQSDRKLLLVDLSEQPNESSARAEQLAEHMARKYRLDTDVRLASSATTVCSESLALGFDWLTRDALRCCVVIVVNGAIPDALWARIETASPSVVWVFGALGGPTALPYAYRRGAVHLNGGSLLRASKCALMVCPDPLEAVGAAMFRDGNAQLQDFACVYSNALVNVDDFFFGFEAPPRRQPAGPSPEPETQPPL